MSMINEKYEQLLEVLATKLGTTVEHLWDVLIKQATISGLTDLVICSILVLAAWWVVVFVKQKTTPREGVTDWHGDEVPACCAYRNNRFSHSPIYSSRYCLCFYQSGVLALKQPLSMVTR